MFVPGPFALTGFFLSHSIRSALLFSFRVLLLLLILLVLLHGDTIINNRIRWSRCPVLSFLLLKQTKTQDREGAAE